MDSTAPATGRWLRVMFWVVLPLGVLATSFYLLLKSKPESGWATLPLHPNAVATMVFSKPGQGLDVLALKEPYALLSFSKTWADARRLSAVGDSLLSNKSGLHTRAGEWIYRPNGQSSYLELFEVEGDSLSPEAWLQPEAANRYLVRSLDNAVLVEPKQAGDGPYLLFWKSIIAIGPDAATLEELIRQPLTLQVERQLPEDVPYGLILSPDRWNLERGGTGLLPFYPVARMAAEARTLVLVPTSATEAGWSFSGLATRSLKGLRWPSAVSSSVHRPTAELSEDGWQVRIGQGMAGNRFVVSQEDTFAALRKRIVDPLIAVRLVMPPATAGGIKAMRLELMTDDAATLATQLKTQFQPVRGMPGTLSGNIPRVILGLPLPGFDTCYLAQGERMVVLSTQPMPPSATAKARSLAAGQDLDLRFTPAHQWSYVQANGPRPLQDLEITLPITFSRFGSAHLKLTGDGVQASLDLLPQPLLGPMVIEKPYFTNLFNSPIRQFGRVNGAARVGYALSQTGRLYFFRPGKLSFAQYQLGPAPLEAAPVYIAEAGMLAWVAGQQVFATDSTGHIWPGYPRAYKGKVMSLCADSGTVVALGIDSAGGPLALRIGKSVSRLPISIPAGERVMGAYGYQTGTHIEAAFVTTKHTWVARMHRAKSTVKPSSLPPRGIVAFTPAQGGRTAAISVSTEGFYSYQIEDGPPFTKQLYKPERESAFKAAVLTDGSAVGTLRYTPSSTTFYDLIGRKRWEIGRNEPLRFFRTGTTELDYFSLAESHDTLRAYNTIGRLAFALPGVKEAGSTLFESEKAVGLLAVPAGRELKWYRVGK